MSLITRKNNSGSCKNSNPCGNPPNTVVQLKYLPSMSSMTESFEYRLVYTSTFVPRGYNSFVSLLWVLCKNAWAKSR